MNQTNSKGLSPRLLAIDVLVSTSGLRVVEINDRPGGLDIATTLPPVAQTSVSQVLAQRISRQQQRAKFAFVLSERFRMSTNGPGTQILLANGDANAKESISQMNSLAKALQLQGITTSFYNANYFRDHHQCLDYPNVYVRANELLPDTGNACALINSFETRALCMSKLLSYRVLSETALQPFLIPTYVPRTQTLKSFLTSLSSLHAPLFVLKPDRGAKGRGVHLVTARRIQSSQHIQRFIEAGRYILQPFMEPKMLFSAQGFGYAVEARLFFIFGEFAGVLFKRASAPFCKFATSTPMSWLTDGSCPISLGDVLKNDFLPLCAIQQVVEVCEPTLKDLSHYIDTHAERLRTRYLGYERQNAHLRARTDEAHCSIDEG
ncbi:hypothetical protein GV819_20220 [Pseudomonas sp. Fl5BN2]|uniref:hypothetical protein n=1 Tax=Pseudomonas sp. Fl5BN2 TaxID=2697652 RepID=UPI001378C4E6|nr:hypothetical protein [Pseudomonas sp. Fl5BN2]NBF04611.1 hypothetical protein [Pseudomonas sp. Fl5BN2]